MRAPLHTSLVLLPLVALGCSGSSEPSSPAASADTAGAESNVELRVIRLLDPGAEPRQALRYQVADGQSERLELDIALAAAAAVEGDEESAQAEAVAPPVRLVVEVGPALALPDGSVRYAVTIREVLVLADEGTDPDLVADLEAEMAPLTEVRGSVEVNALGVTRTSDFEAPETIGTRTLMMLGNIRTSLLTVPLPEEPVGVGARWEVTRQLSFGGIAVEQTVTYTLSSLSAPQGVLTVGIRQSGAPQPIPGFAGGVTGQLEAYESSGAGTVDFDLTRITPYSEGELTTRILATTTDAEGNTSRADLRTSAAVAVAPVP